MLFLGYSLDTGKPINFETDPMRNCLVIGEGAGDYLDNMITPAYMDGFSCISLKNSLEDEHLKEDFPIDERFVHVENLNGIDYEKVDNFLKKISHRIGSKYNKYNKEVPSCVVFDDVLQFFTEDQLYRLSSMLTLSYMDKTIFLVGISSITEFNKLHPYFDIENLLEKFKLRVLMSEYDPADTKFFEKYFKNIEYENQRSNTVTISIENNKKYETLRAYRYYISLVLDDVKNREF